MADFEQLCSLHYGFIYKFLLSLCRDSSLAEELTQETFFRAYINIKQLRNDSRAVAWLCSIARNLYYSHYNEDKRLLPLDDSIEPASEDTTAESAELKILSQQAMQCLFELDEPYREVFGLKVFGDLPLKEISAMYGKSESWARVTFYRAKQMIAERME